MSLIIDRELSTRGLRRKNGNETMRGGKVPRARPTLVRGSRPRVCDFVIFSGRSCHDEEILRDAALSAQKELSSFFPILACSSSAEKRGQHYGMSLMLRGATRMFGHGKQNKLGELINRQSNTCRRDEQNQRYQQRVISLSARKSHLRVLAGLMAVV